MTNLDKYFGTPKRVIKTMSEVERCALDAIDGYADCKYCKGAPCASIDCENFGIFIAYFILALIMELVRLIAWKVSRK